MTDTSIIQQARDVLKKWREDATSDGETPWTTSYDPSAYPYSAFVRGYEVVEAATPGIARLAIGTAGNPDLLEAIDGLLASAQSIAASTPGMIRFLERAERIAAAIIAADERMNATAT